MVGSVGLEHCRPPEGEASLLHVVVESPWPEAELVEVVASLAGLVG